MSWSAWRRGKVRADDRGSRRNDQNCIPGRRRWHETAAMGLVEKVFVLLPVHNRRQVTMNFV